MVFVTGTTPMQPHTELMSAPPPHPPFMLNRYNSKLPLQAYIFRADLNPQAVYAPPGPFSQDHVVTRGSVSILNSGKLWASKTKALKLISLFPRLFFIVCCFMLFPWGAGCMQWCGDPHPGKIKGGCYAFRTGLISYVNNMVPLPRLKY